MSPNDADGMANSVDPDQTSSLIWVCTVCPGISVRKQDHYGIQTGLESIATLFAIPFLAYTLVYGIINLYNV